MIPQFDKILGCKFGGGGSWLELSLEKLQESNECCIAYCSPMRLKQSIIKADYKDIKIYGFNKKQWKPYYYDKSLEKTFRTIIEDFNPDIVHIFGTEFPHTLAMVRAFNNPLKTVIHIQGLCFFWGGEYTAFLSKKVVNGMSFRDFLRHDNIAKQQKKFLKRGRFEIEALCNVKYVMGRTTWDKVAVKQINPKVTYHYCPETLRSVFYEAPYWNIDNCVRHSIFMSQGDYPIKALHIALEALSIVRKDFPDAKLFVAGNNIVRANSLLCKLKQSYYSKYLNSIIKNNNLQGSVIFTGILNAVQMKEMFLKSNVYILPSVMENSPNSLSEAMITGVPSVASYVGGIPDMVTHGVDGFLYQANAPYMLSHFIMNIFLNDNLTKTISENARNRYLKTDGDNNKNILVDIYKSILKKCE